MDDLREILGRLKESEEEKTAAFAGIGRCSNEYSEDIGFAIEITKNTAEILKEGCECVHETLKPFGVHEICMDIPPGLSVMEFDPDYDRAPEFMESMEHGHFVDATERRGLIGELPADDRGPFEMSLFANGEIGVRMYSRYSDDFYTMHINAAELLERAESQLRESAPSMG